MKDSSCAACTVWVQPGMCEPLPVHVHASIFMHEIAAASFSAGKDTPCKSVRAGRLLCLRVHRPTGGSPPGEGGVDPLTVTLPGGEQTQAAATHSKLAMPIPS